MTNIIFSFIASVLLLMPFNCPESGRVNNYQCSKCSTLVKSERTPSTLHWVTVNSSITFIGQPRGEVISAEAICRHMGETSCLYQVDIKDGDYLVAEVMVSGHRLD